MSSLRQDSLICSIFRDVDYASTVVANPSDKSSFQKTQKEKKKESFWKIKIKIKRNNFQPVRTQI